MDTLNGHRRMRALIVGGVLAAALVMPLSVSADTTGGGAIQPAYSRGATINLGTVHIVSKVLSTVDISFTCDPLQVFDWETGMTTTTTDGRIDSATAVIVQASGKTIVVASGDAFGGAVLCDGSTVHSLTVQVVASAAPFKAGAAAVGATVSVADPSFQAADNASTGAATVKLGK
jgi:hypothetical protein